MSTLSEVPAYQMLNSEMSVASGNPLAYFVARHIRPGIFIYTPTPTIVAGFVEERDAEIFIKAATNAADSYSIYCSRKHYDLHAPLLPAFKEKWKDHLI